jgi:hypothetical protein
LRTFADCVAVFFILHFLWSYYWNCYRKGFRIDFWHMVLFQALFITSIMLPFNRSPLNVISFGPILVKKAMPFVDEAFLISALGYGCFIVGGSLWRINLHIGLRKTYARILNLPVRASVLILRSPRLMLLLGAIAIILIGGILALYFTTVGFGLRVEGYLLEHPEVRPFAQFAAFIAVTVGGLALGRYEIRRERSMLLLTVVITIALFFYGARSFIQAVIQIPLLVWLIRRRTRVYVILLPMMFVVALFGAIFLDSVRHGEFSLKKILVGAGMAIAFGNSFSDTRDFALILSLWDRTFFLGKTYLAGILAFVPRFLSPFRDRWALGVVTATMAGFSPTAHAGLRIGSSGEAYLNFGLPAVVLLGLVGGSISRYIDMRVKEAVVRDPQDLRVYGYFILTLLTGALVNTVNFSALYTVAMLMIVSGAIVLLSRFIKIPLG